MLGNADSLPLLLLRVGVAFSLIYAAVAGFIEPNSWVGFLPSFTSSIMNPETALMIVGVLQIIVGLGLLFMKDPFLPAIAAAVFMAGIVLFNFPLFDIVFRDVPILIASIAIALSSSRFSPDSKELVNN